MPFVLINPFFDSLGSTILLTSRLLPQEAPGNDDKDSSNYSPSRVAGVISVGSSNIDDSKRATSNYGSAIGVFAPGGNIISAFNTSDTATATKSGTSQVSEVMTLGGLVSQFRFNVFLRLLPMSPVLWRT